MADNVNITEGSGKVIAADDIASVFFQRVKISLGADGTAVDAVAGAGAVDTGTQRVTLASDDPAVVALQVMDDWDESDRAKVNIIAGQAGVDAGSGIISTGTQRVTVATDDTVATSLSTLAGAVSGSEVQVDVLTLPSLPAGANAIGSVTIGAALPTGSNTIGAVTVSGTATVSGSVSITGTPTVNLGATDNAVLDSIDTSNTAIQTALETAGGLVVNLGSNNDVTVTGTVDLGATDNAVLDSIATNTSNIATAVQLIDNAISGNEMQVDVVAALPAGANTIGGVTIAAALPTGSNTIGKVTNDVLTDFGAGEYETVAASQTDQVLGATGATGDFLAALVIVPATTAAGAVSIKDGAGSAITVFTGGTDSVGTLHPFAVPLNLLSSSGAWSVTTSTNVSVIAVGNFT